MVKILKWLGISIVALIMLMIGGYAYLVLSFDTKNFPENHGVVEAELFLGDGENQPLIVGFGGGEGGNAWASDFWKEQRDEFISRGYAVLAIGYFGAKGTPQNLDRIALEGVHQAILETANHPNINGECIAAIGGSKGGELSLLLASHFPEIKSVIAIVPGSAVFPALTIAMNTPSFSLNGELLPFVPVPWSATPALIEGDLRAVWEEMLKNEEAVERAAIKVENINGPILFVSATQDEFWPSKEMSDAMMQRLQTRGFPFYADHLVVEGSHSAPLGSFDDVEIFLETHFLNNERLDCSSHTGIGITE